MSALFIDAGNSHIAVDCKNITDSSFLQIRALELSHYQLQLNGQLLEPVRNQRLTYLLPRGDSHGVLTLRSNIARPLTFWLADAKQFNLSNIWHSCVMFLYLGLALTLVLYNLLLGIRLKSSLFSLYSLYTLSLAVFLSLQEGIPLLITGNNENLIPAIFWSSLAVLSGSAFFSRMMQLHRHYPKALKLTVLLPGFTMLALALTTGTSHIFQSTANSLLNYLAIVVILSLLVMTALRLKHKDRDAVWVTLALGILLIGMLLRQSHFNTTSYISYYVMIIAATVEALMLAALVSQRLAILREEHQHAVTQANTDPLTGLLNRAGWQAAASLQQTEPEQHSLLFIDLDKFKDINDSFGHQAGDDALKAVAKMLTSTLGKNAIIGRYAGDEFVAFISDASIGIAKAKVETLEHRLKQLKVAGQTFTVSGSVGAYYLHAEDNLEEALAKADASMYQHKSDKKASS